MNCHSSVGIISELQTRAQLYGSESTPSMGAKIIKRKDGSGGREIQEAMSLTVRSQRNHPRRPVTPFVSRRAGSSHSGFPCGPPSAATTAAAPCSPIQPGRVTTSAGSRCRIHRSLYCSSQQTGANPRLLGECHDNRFLASSHHAVPELVSPGEVCSTTLQKLDACGEELLTAIVSVAYRATEMFPLLDSIHISTRSWAVHKGGCERSILFEGKTGTVTNRPLPGLGPKPREFGIAYIEMGTSSRSI